MDKRAELVERMLEAYTYASRSGITNGMSAALDLALEEAAREAEQTNTALLRDGSFFSERVAAAIRALKSKPHA